MTRVAMGVLTVAFALGGVLAALNEPLWLVRTLLCGGFLAMAALLYGEIRKGAR